MHVHHSSGARETVLSLQITLSLTRNMNVTVAKELYYIFSEISKLDTGNFSLTLSILENDVESISTFLHIVKQ